MSTIGGGKLPRMCRNSMYVGIGRCSTQQSRLLKADCIGLPMGDLYVGCRVNYTGIMGHHTIQSIIRWGDA